jgi:hypothetical protein
MLLPVGAGRQQGSPTPLPGGSETAHTLLPGAGSGSPRPHPRTRSRAVCRSTAAGACGAAEWRRVGRQMPHGVRRGSGERLGHPAVDR